MATVTPRDKSWRVQIRRLGHAPVSKSFPRNLFTKAQAWAWAAQCERELISGVLAPAKHTLGAAFDKYAAEVSPTKRGARWEQYRLLADPIRLAPMADKRIGQVTATDLAMWRDHRLKAVSAGTVRREMNLIDSVLEIARKEWRWIAANPIRDVAKPPSPRARRRRIPESEITAVCAKLTGPAGKQVAAGFKLGIETGMRAGEMWSLERSQIDLKRGVAHLEQTKNGDERNVPLSKAARKIIRALLKDKRPALFTISKASRDVLFRRARDAAGVENLHFHDSRAEAVWRLSKKLDPLELGRAIGHRNPKSLYLYYEADAAELARKLDA